jgi:glycosyltransferase involved in cell wall biosynthesis
MIVPYENSEEIYNAMKELLGNKKLSANLISNGKKDVEQRFSIDKMMLSLEQLYEQ